MRNWVLPFAIVQSFQPSEYIAACYDVSCNLGSASNKWCLFQDTNKHPGLDVYDTASYDADAELICNTHGCEGTETIRVSGKLAANAWLVYTDVQYDCLYAMRDDGMTPEDANIVCANAAVPVFYYVTEGGSEHVIDPANAVSRGNSS